MDINYKKTEWQDHILDPETGTVIQQGTRFTAQRANNFEDGIAYLYSDQTRQDAELQKLQVQLETVGRAPVNNGTFFDALDGDTKQLTLSVDNAIVQSALPVGATSVTLNEALFSNGEFVTIYDNSKSEVVRVTAVNAESISVSSALSNAYPKGAQVARSNAVVDTSARELKFGVWGTYSIAASEVI